MKSYTGMIYSNLLKRDIEFWIEPPDLVVPDLTAEECLWEEDVIEEIKNHYENMGDN